METLGCAHVARREYQTCSHGEKQKLLIARALMASPELLILDEPCTGLDFVREAIAAGLRRRLTRRADAPDAPVRHPPRGGNFPRADPRVCCCGTLVSWRKVRRTEVLTDERLSEMYGVPVQVRWQNRQTVAFAGRVVFRGTE